MQETHVASSSMILTLESFVPLTIFTVQSIRISSKSGFADG